MTSAAAGWDGDEPYRSAGRQARLVRRRIFRLCRPVATNGPALLPSGPGDPRSYNVLYRATAGPVPACRPQPEARGIILSIPR